jgi:adenylylsulfate kinase
MKENLVRHNATVTRDRREQLNKHKSFVIWFTGYSGSGKSTLAHTVEEQLHQMGCRTYVLDGDNVRHGLCGDLGFSDEDRKENLRRIGEMVKLFVDAGIITLAAFISPSHQGRGFLKQMFDDGKFIEIYCKCSLEECERRDVKGLYKKAREGKIAHFTGISSDYEVPLNPDLVLDTEKDSAELCVHAIFELIKKQIYL